MTVSIFHITITVEPFIVIYILIAVLHFVTNSRLKTSLRKFVTKKLSEISGKKLTKYKKNLNNY